MKCFGEMKILSAYLVEFVVKLFGFFTNSVLCKYINTGHIIDFGKVIRNAKLQSSEEFQNGLVGRSNCLLIIVFHFIWIDGLSIRIGLTIWIDVRFGGGYLQFHHHCKIYLFLSPIFN